MNMCKKMILATAVLSVVAVSSTFGMRNCLYRRDYKNFLKLNNENQAKKLMDLRTPSSLYDHMTKLFEKSGEGWRPYFKYLAELKPEKKCRGKSLVYAIMLDDVNLFNRVFSFRPDESIGGALKASLLYGSVDIAFYLVKQYLKRTWLSTFYFFTTDEFFDDLLKHSVQRIKTRDQVESFLSLLDEVGQIDGEVGRQILSKYSKAGFLGRVTKKHRYNILQLAAVFGNYEFVRVLLENNVDVTYRDKEGKDALDMAVEQFGKKIKGYYRDNFYYKDGIEKNTEKIKDICGSYEFTVRALLEKLDSEKRKEQVKKELKRLYRFCSRKKLYIGSFCVENSEEFLSKIKGAVVRFLGGISEKLFGESLLEEEEEEGEEENELVSPVWIEGLPDYMQLPGAVRRN